VTQHNYLDLFILIGSIGRNMYIYIFILSYQALVTQHNYLNLITGSLVTKSLYMQFLPHFKWGILKTHHHM